MSKENESKELIIDAEYTDIRPLETIEYEINELTKQAQTANENSGLAPLLREAACVIANLMDQLGIPEKRGIENESN